ncbi:MAG: hypothetical protein AMXMBFR74_24190 [Parvibaculum sp.]|jgi:transcriptional regulator with XRE-family HTH domain|uniref:helix-turn-helix domain-containing protein n=1 Tax=Parvibaculum sp. TaxID=2024848 RepID=UPI0035B9CF89
MLTAEQIKAARALLSWGQSDLAEASGLSLPTIKRVEAARGTIRSTPATIAAIRKALEAAGIDFIQNGVVGVTRRHL